MTQKDTITKLDSNWYNLLDKYGIKSHQSNGNEYEIILNKKLNPIKTGVLTSLITIPLIAGSLYFNSLNNNNRCTIHSQNSTIIPKKSESKNNLSNFDKKFQSIKQQQLNQNTQKNVVSIINKDKNVSNHIDYNSNISKNITSENKGDKFEINGISYNVLEYSKKSGNQFDRLNSLISLPETGYSYNLEEKNKNGIKTFTNLNFGDLENTILNLRNNGYNDIFKITKNKLENNYSKSTPDWVKNTPLTEVKNNNTNMVKYKSVWDGRINADLDGKPGVETYTYDPNGFSKFYDFNNNAVPEKIEKELLNIVKKSGYLK